MSKHSATETAYFTRSLGFVCRFCWCVCLIVRRTSHTYNTLPSPEVCLCLLTLLILHYFRLFSYLSCDANFWKRKYNFRGWRCCDCLNRFSSLKNHSFRDLIPMKTFRINNRFFKFPSNSNTTFFSSYFSAVPPEPTSWHSCFYVLNCHKPIYIQLCTESRGIYHLEYSCSVLDSNKSNFVNFLF